MDVQSKLQKLKKRLGLTAALSIAAMSASSAEQQDSIIAKQNHQAQNSL